MYKLIVLSIIIILVATAIAQVKPASAPVPLTPDETKEVTEALIVHQQAAQLTKQRENEALNGSLDKAAELLGNWQSAFFKTELTKREVERVLNKHRTTHTCPDCFYTEDYKALAKRQTQP